MPPSPGGRRASAAVARLIAIAFFLLAALPAWAHQTSVTAARADLATDHLTVTLDLRQADLLHAVLHAGGDRHAFHDEQELRDGADAVLAHVRGSVRVTQDGKRLAPAPSQTWPGERPTLQVTGPGGLPEPATLPLTLEFPLPQADGRGPGRLEIAFDLYDGGELSPIFELQFRRVEAGSPAPAAAAAPIFLSRGEARVLELSPPAASLQAASTGASEAFLAVLARFGSLGFRHILPDGLDHILFVLGLFLLAPGLRPLLVQVTAFTLAHSLTLALSVLGLFTLPGRIVEPLIALSIAVIALENLTTRRVRPWRWAVVFLFGLVHGLGFADGLREAGLPAGRLFPALLGFNLGVEAGQLAVIFLAAAVTRGVSQREWYARRVAAPASLLIAGMGLFWTVQRLWWG